MANAAAIAPQSGDHFIDAGDRLRQARERLDLTVREVAHASQAIAEKHSKPGFAIKISRLSEIENHGIVPSIYRLYSLCCIYRLNLSEVLGWYGAGLENMAADGATIHLGRTHSIDFPADPGTELMLPISMNPGIDLKKNVFISEVVHRWGKVPLALLSEFDYRRFRYAFVGTEDWAMHPLVPAGSLLVIDEGKRRIQAGGWTSHATRPIYFLEHRDGFYCRWCSLSGDMLSLMPDPASDAPVLHFKYPGEIEVVGQVVGLAISLDREPPRRNRT